MTDKQIYNELLKYVSSGQFVDWYVGITNDIEKRLFTAHNVNRNGVWFHAPAINSIHARSAEQALLKLGFDGGTGGGDHTAVYVYAFRKDPGTVRD